MCYDVAGVVSCMPVSPLNSFRESIYCDNPEPYMSFYVCSVHVLSLLKCECSIPFLWIIIQVDHILTGICIAWMYLRL